MVPERFLRWGHSAQSYRLAVKGHQYRQRWALMLPILCGIGSWSARCLSMGDYVTGLGAPRGVTARRWALMLPILLGAGYRRACPMLRWATSTSLLSKEPLHRGYARTRHALSEAEGKMTERISLKGKVAVVTGAGRGLGRAYVELLAERGARVVVNDLGTDVSGFGKDPTIAEQVADLIRSRGGEAIANDSDVSTPEGGTDLIATTIQHFGRIDLLVNNAGICGSQPFEDATLDDFDHYWRVHVGGPVNTVKAAWPHMIAQRYGKIILTTSVVGLFGMRGQATYASAKGAVVGFMRSLAIEGAEHGILVNTISPVGYTRMHPAAGSRTSEADGKAATPVEAVAPAIVWLASDGCSETNRIYNVEAGAIQRIAIVMGPGFYDPHLTPESIAENYARVESIEGFSEPDPFEPGT
jgi:NAD(P)-dependent dehydrogenase (short-subunit alcohol dehydrogenase family)